jgi:hypothetical protein
VQPWFPSFRKIDPFISILIHCHWYHKSIIDPLFEELGVSTTPTDSYGLLRRLAFWSRMWQMPGAARPFFSCKDGHRSHGFCFLDWYVYWCSLMFIDVYWCLLMFIVLESF